ncbi:hypothetical protein GQF56_18825 [Rhodobacter sphaeroides]|jgi:Predicted periplasmic protein|uniref:Periplasmic protein n=1 Tax=Cereibacter sphaeroides (strain ATCC 17023 / DSM 158 / JCM 6121 / CCUG 31486 / LMG 2827 / NBRC 12203 / NCIMB 8253 / ATH 2.4.1.) TaxID=272943 RepID=Q3IXQ0_CERS4|nr:hypothetical protein [Cereibacter sphaeroides]ABA80684.1 putative periplasmic protein [Cereibacter sphaeroides 2.4.1]AMJ49012.1 hypothetical protein APX01_15660 [Cereibacter sphaeroides]ANS35728.1 hypothetical protein A3858_15680 [Cereibacter sphaeroides]ATN64781.1 hypothetical protein A3857_15675 [Cereibacter sphaeroides]AXC62978.1 hypothetical protein DQL45_16365 [Cereibacter sphaeroides 2.4.1]
MSAEAAPRRAIWAMLILQVGIGAALIGMDLARPAPPSPADLFAPASVPQMRPYRPDLRPAPGTDGPQMRPMPARLEFGGEGARVTLTGQIAAGDAARFSALLEQRGERPEVVELDSSGGVVSEALLIGRQIRALGAATEVEAGAVCLSACPYLLAGGVERRVAEGGLVGVHQHYFGENSLLPAFLAVEDVQRGQAEVMRYLDEMGVDPRLMMHGMETPAREIYMLDAARLAELRLSTEGA